MNAPDAHDLSVTAAIECQHRLLCHRDGSLCEDGCNRQVAWCKCDSIPYTVGRRAGWLVCGACGKPIGGGQ